jgi:phosphate transport system substrate-binding protein
MKRIFALLLSGMILLSACGTFDVPEVPEVTDEPDITTTPPTTTTTPPITTTTPTITTTAPPAPEPEPEPILFPNLDGTTLTILMEDEIRTTFRGRPIDTSVMPITRTPVEIAFERLLEGEVDGLFSMPLTAHQKELLTEANIELEMIPLSLEALVFVVNKSNPVDTLTSEQLRKIYSGEITNWSQVGGNNAEINVFHNYDNSGSRSLMLNFMGDISLTEDIYKIYNFSWYIGTPHFDWGINSIGYAVYNHEDALYAGMNEVKYIRVNGTAPTSENLNTGSYPILGNLYLMFDKTQPDDSLIRQLADFLQTDEGKAIIDNHRNISQEDITPMSSLLGTGIARPQNLTSPVYQYRVSNNYNLADEEIERKINDDIRTFFPDLTDNEIRRSRPNQTINGYITFHINTDRHIYRHTYGDLYEREHLTYDLYTGERVEFSDFFFEGEIFTPYVNRSVLSLRRYSRIDGTWHFLKPFWGIKETQSSAILFPNPSFYNQYEFFENIFMSYGPLWLTRDMSLFYSEFDMDYKIFTPAIPRDMKGIFADDGVVGKYYISHRTSERHENDGISYSLFTPDDGWLSDDVRRKANDYILNLSNLDNLKNFIRENASDNPRFSEEIFNHEDFFPVYISAEYCGDFYLTIRVICFGYYKYDSMGIEKHFSPRTFENIGVWYHLSNLDNVLKEGWLYHVAIYINL